MSLEPAWGGKFLRCITVPSFEVFLDFLLELLRERDELLLEDDLDFDLDFDEDDEDFDDFDDYDLLLADFDYESFYLQLEGSEKIQNTHARR